MDGFNPLDLLASAAELQQKHDDGPERIIITRQRRSNVAKNSVVSSGQKENREQSHNNNNNISKNKPSVVIVKKIKKVDINPDLEKMLDEHNYGNAKRNNVKIDKGPDSGLEINGRRKKRIDFELDNYCNSEQFVQTTTTEGQNVDKITTVVSNTSSQPSDSECIHVKCKVDCTDKGTCSNRICTCKHETTENKCSKFDEGTKCDCQGQTKVVLDRKQPCDNVSRTPDTLIMKHDSKQQANCDISVDNSELSSYNEDGLKLDEQTGEFISKSGAKILINHSVDEKGCGQDSSFGTEQKLSVFNTENVVAAEMGSGKAVKVETVSSQVLTKSTSESKKMPYVKVVPSEVSELAGDKQPQTLVINITRGRNSGDKFSTACIENLSDRSSDGKSSDIGIIRSLLAKNKICELNTDDNTGHKKKPVILSIMSTKPNFEIPDCKRELSEKSLSCDSLKEFELTDTVCTDDSSSSVHLLSPDCRNPDSMGIAESPVTHNVNELSYSGNNVPVSSFSSVNEEHHTLFDSPEKLGTEARIELSIKSGTFSAVTSSPLHLNMSDNAVDPETPGVETASDARELTGDCGLLLTEKPDNCDNSANDTLPASTSGNDIPVFRFDSDHCYAGMPGKINSTIVSIENDNSIQSEEGSEAPTPLESTSELSQDSGYEDVTQSPEVEQPSISMEESIEKRSAMKNLVPVLVSVNSNGCLTVHDTNLTKTLGGQVYLPENMKVITGTNFTSISQAPLILSPVAVGKNTSPVLAEPPKLVQAKADSIIGLLSPKTPEVNTMPNDSQEMSPPKYGKFRIGTFASFSNTGGSLDSPTKTSSPVKVQSEEKPKKISPASTQSRSSRSGKSSPVVDTLGTLVQKVKSSLSPVSQVEMNGVDHIQHDHDYCTKNLMPSVINSFLEARLLSKGKVTNTKGKKLETDYKTDNKAGKRKRNATSVTKEDIQDDFEVDSESDTYSIPEPLRPKYRSEKYIEPKRTDPKVKITGSSNFQDQFVYFMNTKKRSRRRESKDVPLPYGTDRVFIPPKPGDIVVPHLTDQDIENLRIRSKQSKHSTGTSCCNSLRNEFMAAKLSNGTFSATQPAETVDDEKNIINTILSLENEDLASPVQNEPAPYNESMELYGQGLSADIMNLLPEQMNLTPEQMDLLYSAVDEVQNSSPGLVGAEKLVSTDTTDSAFQFPVATFENSGIVSTTTEVDRETSVETAEAIPNIDEAKKTSEEGVSADIETQSVTEAEETVETPTVETDQISAGDKKLHENSKSEQVLKITVEEKTDVDMVVSDGNTHATTAETLAVPFSNSGNIGIHTPNVTMSGSDNKEESTKSDNLMVPRPEITEEKTLFPSSDLSNGGVTTSFESDINSVNSSSITSEISLPQIDKSLDLLGNDFRLDKGDLFPDATVSDNTVASSVVQPPAQVDYNAPWIVTVSMYWNDLPAIMINNQPFVRLVDIHKQILPAKDTGILKKRCQLMGIEVENCSEMQRYFLVQYGRAFNSKSTLIISKDNAKFLIGYYVDPQPKTARPEDHHKSIIDHRREQLRRIALARRAAVRAQRLSEKKDEPDPREIKEPPSNVEADMTISSSLHEESKNTEVPKVRCSPALSPLVQTDGGRLQRATRHKKINFLEMLRGDSTNHAGEQEATDEHGKKQSQKVHVSTEGKTKRMTKEKKVKIVKYTIETDSSEETESVQSDSSSESYDSESTSGSEIQVLKKPVKQRKIHPTLFAKVKSRMKTIPKSYNKGSLKVKIGLKKSGLNTSAPVAVQVVNKPTNTSKLAASVYRSKMTSQKSRKESSSRSYSPPVILGKSVLTMQSQDLGKGLTYDMNNMEVQKAESSMTAPDVENKINEINLQTKHSIHMVGSVLTDNNELKISPTLPENILDTGDLPESKTEEFPKSILMESVNIQTDSGSFENNVDNSMKTCNAEVKIKGNKSEEQSMTVNPAEIESRSQSQAVAETSVSVMKRKENLQISSDETPIRIIHSDSSPQTHQRTRSQLGELFVGYYHNKKSLCVCCYTCRKMMSVDNFLRHLHDISSGLLSVNTPRTINLCDPDLNESEYKHWETFLRKKELFDNNQLPSPDIVGDSLIYNGDGDSNHSFPETGSKTDTSAQPGPRIITTPVSPLKKEKVVRKNKLTAKTRLISNQPSLQVPVNKKQTVLVDSAEGVRTSSRKRKVKHLYGFEDYSFTKFPRLMKNAVVEEDSNSDGREKI